MAEERIAERIDANLMNVSMEDLHDLPKTMFESKIKKIQKKTIFFLKKKLIMSSNHFMSKKFYPYLQE